MLIIINYIIILALIFYTIAFYIRTKKSINIIKKQENNSKTNCNKKIIIAIPCLREQACIEETIKYFSKIAKNIPIIIITTKKEEKENINNDVLTKEIIKNNILPKYKNVYLVDYPKTEGYMADQLNYMLENLDFILKRKVDLSNTYLALYNADSRPNEKTFDEINDKINQGHKIIQQYSYCMKNYENLNNILKGFSIYQSNFELKTGIINGLLKSKLLYTHVVGHGLVINMETLKKLGNFNTEFWCEDIYLGLQLKFNNLRIEPMLTLENMETPTKFKNLIKQNSVWFKTTSQFSKMYKDIIRKGNFKSKINGFIGCFNEFRCAINWLCFPMLLMFLIISSILIKDFGILIVGIISYFLYIGINTIMTMKLINILDKTNYKVSLKMILNVAIATAISNFGPIYSILTKKKEKYKTERGNYE